MSTLQGVVNDKADADTVITGGSYSNNTLTLNRQVGNINIGGFPSGGAQSVNVSLSGSTLTVDVDGNSDSVSLSSFSQPELYHFQGTVTESNGDFMWEIGFSVNKSLLGTQTGILRLWASDIDGNPHITQSYSNDTLSLGGLDGREYAGVYIVQNGTLELSGGTVYNLKSEGVSFE